MAPSLNCERAWNNFVTLGLLEDAADRDWTEKGGRMMNMSFRVLKRGKTDLFQTSVEVRESKDLLEMSTGVN